MSLPALVFRRFRSTAGWKQEAYSTRSPTACSPTSHAHRHGRAVDRVRDALGSGASRPATWTRDGRFILWPGRDAYVEASRPWSPACAAAGSRRCRGAGMPLLTWATVGFAAVESGVPLRGAQRTRSRPGSDPRGVTEGESDALFDLHIRYLIEGIADDMESQG